MTLLIKTTYFAFYVLKVYAEVDSTPYFGGVNSALVQ